MLLILNVLLVLLAAVVAVVAIGGVTWRKDEPRLLRCITLRGWLSLGCVVLTVTVGIGKELLVQRESNHQKAENQQLRGGIRSQLTVIGELRSELKDANATINETRTKLIEAQLAGQKTTDAIQRYSSPAAAWT